jgi:hypothetical protein
MGRALLVTVAMVACSSQPSTRHSGASQHHDLVGTWDVSLSLTQPYPLGLGAPPARKICGTISFVENHEPDPGSNSDSSQNLGVFDLDLSHLGLDWLPDGSLPTAVASIPADAISSPSSHDSLTIVLNDGSHERIVLRGVYDVDGVRGDWSAQSARGTAIGEFLLTPRARARDGARSDESKIAAPETRC